MTDFPCPPPTPVPFAGEQCRHYSWEGDFFDGFPVCRASVLIEDGNVLLAKTCLGKPEASCTKREEYTEAERAAQDAYMRKVVERDLVCMKVIPRGGPGESGEVACPACGAGTITWGRASCNGHLHASCSTPNCFSMMQ